MSRETNTETGNWFGDLLMSFMPEDYDIEGMDAKELVSNASWKAAATSTIAGLPPGPIGMLTIIPELIAVTKVQVNLVYAIAKFYGKASKLNKTLILLIFANALSLEVGKDLVRKFGVKLIIRALRNDTVKKIAEKIGLEILTKVSGRAAGRWFSVLLAPVFGALSYSFTNKIGEEAIKLFKEEIDIEEPLVCSEGHENFGDSKFCSECGEKL